MSDKINVNFSDLERAWSNGGTHRIGRIRVVDKLESPYFKAFDFVVGNVEGVYRMQHNLTTNEVVLFRKVERIESVTRWIPVDGQNVSKSVGGDEKIEGDERGTNGSVST